MKWLIAVLLILAVLLSGYAIYRTHRIEAKGKPQMKLIATSER